MKIFLFFILIVFLPVSVLCQGSPFVPNDPYFFYNATERPGFPGQWHLINNAPSGGILFTIPDGGTSTVLMRNSGVDAGLRDAWKMGYTGKGVVIGIVDDGVEGTHEDIAPNYKSALSRNFSSDKSIADAAQGPIDNDDNHGQAVAGVAAARGGNGIGGTGAAPYASIVGLNPYPGKEINNTAIRALYVESYYWKSGVDPLTGKITAKPQINIMNHSYGQKTPWNLNDDLHGSDITTALNRTAGNGIIHVWSAGNERGIANEDTGKDNVLTNSNVIPVAALGSDEKFSDYSNYGSNVFVTAPSSRSGLYSGYYTFGITTTDRTGASLGYNRYSTENKKGDWTDLFPDYNYTSTFGGTSSSAPLVSGILALGMEANKQMDVRMAKHVLVQTSTMVDPNDASTTGGWVKNGAGNWFNPNYGFGNINAGKFVETVKKVAYVTKQTSYSTGTQTVNEAIKYLDNNNNKGTSKEFTLTTNELPASLRQPLEGVEVDLNFTHTKRGDLTASITSPYATKSRLFNSTKDLPTGKQDTESVTNFGWTFLTNAFWGEDPLGGKTNTSGKWTVTMGDVVNNGVGTWNSYKVTLLMGDIVFNSTEGTTTQTENIKARSLTIKQPDAVFKNPSGMSVVVEEQVQVTSGELNVNGAVTMSRPADDDDPEDGIFILDGGIVSGTGIIDAPYGFYHTGGTIKPGNSIGTLTINGDYYQGAQGKLLIEVASTTSNDLLAINGAADLNGILQTSWSGGYTPAIRTKFGTILTASSGITGQFTSLLTNITPTVLFKPKYDIPNQIYLMVERDYTNQNLLLYLTANQRAVGSMLNSVGNTATGDLDTVLHVIDDLPAYGLDQLAPRGSEAISGMGISGASFQTGNLSERLSDLRRGIRGLSFTGLYYRNTDFIANGKETPVLLASAGSDLTGMLPSGVNERWGFFVKGNIVSGDQKDSPDRTGYDFTSAGVTVGSDYRFTGNFIAGLMLGINTARANVDSMGSKVKTNGYTLGTYGTYYDNGFYIDGSISYGLTDYDNTRRIVFPGLDRTATSSPDGNQITAYGGTGYEFRMNRWMITPTVSFQYTKLNTDSYTEKGAGAINLDVDRQNTESLQGNIGGRISFTWQTDSAVIMPGIRASYGYEFLRGSQNITSRLAQGSSPFSIETMSPDRNFISLGAGITAFTVRDMSVYINYDVQIGENKYVAQSVNAGLRVGF
ncbi:MAG: autotransporter domain-containing protein [Proteobacteria bacterium]|nr:autotransporter domain-containing protein [Pseudomonadota bacterium]